MRILMLFLIVLGGAVSMLIGCAPNAAAIGPLPIHLISCDTKGVCCYDHYEREFSCVATRVEVVLPKDIPEGDSKTGGEVTGEKLDKRLFIP